jgi:hypothetical protein
MGIGSLLLNQGGEGSESSPPCGGGVPAGRVVINLIYFLYS